MTEVSGSARRWSSDSLLSRLLRGMILPMTGLAVLLAVGGALVIRQAVETTNDRILGAASRAIAESLTVEDGQIALNLSPAIFGMLEDAQRDNIFYSVRSDGRVVTGYADLPRPRERSMRDTEVAFSDAVYRGTDVRIVSEGRKLSGIGAPVIVEVAETLGARQRTERRLLLGLGLLEAALIGLSVLLLPVAIRWGMRPLTLLREEMDQRLADDLKPLPSEGVPAELRQLVTSFNGMLHRLDGAVQRMKQFTSDASHQLRTPLSILRAHIAVLRRNTGDAAASIDDIDAASERLQRLVVQLLALARADSAVLGDSAMTAVDLNGLAAEIAAEHFAAAAERGIALQLERADGPAVIASHPVFAGEMIGNFIDNAIRYGDAGGSVTIGVSSRRPERIELTVEDDGPGIPPADRTQALARFSRLARDTGRQGSGLGLSIADTLARSIGAEFALETASSGRGLLVRVSFPRATDA